MQTIGIVCHSAKFMDDLPRSRRGISRASSHIDGTYRGGITIE